MQIFNVFKSFVIFILRFFDFGFNFATTNFRREKENHLYPSISFISELRGSLDLFVEFSFPTVRDFLTFNRKKTQFKWQVTHWFKGGERFSPTTIQITIKLFLTQ